MFLWDWYPDLVYFEGLISGPLEGEYGLTQISVYSSQGGEKNLWIMCNICQLDPNVSFPGIMLQLYRKQPQDPSWEIL